MTTVMPLWPSLNYNQGPISQIQPFTYQDDVTYLDILYLLRDYIKNIVVPQLNQLSEEVDAAITAMLQAVEDAIGAEGERVDAKLAELQANVDTQLTEQNQQISTQLATQNQQVTDQLATQDADVAARIATMVTYVNDAVASIINNSVTVQDPAMAGIVSDIDSQTRTKTDQLYSKVQPAFGSDVTHGYERTIPQPEGVVNGIRMLARDPRVAGRVWGQNLAGDRTIGYTDDEGATFIKMVAPPAGTVAGIPSLRFWNGKAWLLQVPNTGSRRGQLWRSDYPNTDGTGLVFVKMFDLASPPPGLATGDNSTFRSDSVFGVGPNVWLFEYSPAVPNAVVGDGVVGGPSIFYSPNSGTSWIKQKTFANAKHGHGGNIIGGLPWATMGDAGGVASTGVQWSDRGLWSCSAATAAGVWSKRSLGELNIGWAATDLYPINILGMNIGGAPMIVGESDGRHPSGPLVYQGQSVVGSRPLLELNQVPIPFLGSMRHITLTPEGNLMWLQTGEQGAIGDYDTVMISKGPYFQTAIPCEVLPAAPNNFASAGDSTLDGDYVWFGHHRIKRPIFDGQTRVAPAPVPNPPIIPDPARTPDHEWRASTLVGADGTSVATWTPSIGTANFAQATGANQPKIATVAGVKVLSFDGVDDFMESAGIALAQPYTMLMKATVNGYGTNGGGFLTPNGTGVSIRYDSNGRPFMGATFAGTNGDVPNGTKSVFAFVVAGTQSIMRIAARPDIVGDSGAGDINNIRLAYVFTSGSGFYGKLDIEVVRIYRGYLSSSELTTAIADMG